MIDSDSWDRVREVFLEAMDLPPSEREAWIAMACREDSTLAQRVRVLLEAEAESQGFLENPDPAVLGDLAEGLEQRVFEGRRVGPYRLLRVLGRGGMGTVYLASQSGEGFEREVALKILRRGLDTEDLVARFANERQILATLTHPNIAQLHDGGSTEDGRPFLVMEAVFGQPITKYCDEQRCSVDDRVRLLLEVAAAVQAAHSYLVIHRDLKPSNVLVTEEGRVKLLDFGIAKILEAKRGSHRTATGSRLLTPEYAAPEQLDGRPVSVATDVYQLGALLFRLLTGDVPSRQGTSEFPAEPPKPSTLVARSPAIEDLARARATEARGLVSALRGDLGTVVKKALQSEPARRYSTVAELAADLDRVRRGRPVAARPDSVVYRSQKFLGRHPWVGPVLLLALLGVLAFGVTVARYTLRLEAERNRAESEAARAQEVQEFLVGIYRSGDVQEFPDPLRGSDLTVVEAMERGVERLESKLVGRPRLQADILLAISQTYKGLGDYGRGLPVARRALELFEGLDERPSGDYRRALGLVGVMQRAAGELEGAGRSLRRRLELAEKAGTPDIEEIAKAHTTLAHLYRDTEQLDRAAAEVQAILALEGPEGPSLGRLAEAARVQAELYVLESRGEAAEGSARLAISWHEAQSGGTPSQQLALAHGTLATALSAQQRYREAEDSFRTAIEWLEQIAGENYSDRLTQVNNLAFMLLSEGDDTRAEGLLDEAARLAEQAWGPHHATVGDLLQNRGVALSRLGRVEEAVLDHQRAAAIFEVSRAEVDPRRYFPHLSLAAGLLELDRPSGALEAVGLALDGLSHSLPEGHHVTAVASCRRARSLVALGRGSEAGIYFDSAVTILAQQGVLDYRLECLRAAAEWAESLGDRSKAVELRELLAQVEGTQAPS